jgi:hypothetical protein
MKKTRRTKRPARPATVPIGHGSRFLFDVAAIAAARDMAAIRGAHVDPSKTPAPYDHPPRGGRLAAELAHLLTTRDIYTSEILEKAMSRAGALKPIKHAEIQPGSTLPPFIAGTKEIVPGNSLQGGELAIPVTFEHIFAAPANSRVRVGVTVGPFVTATGYSGSKDYRHLGNADGRAFGQVTSVEAILFP